MLPPASQNYFGLLANLSLRINRLAGLQDFASAMETAREALNLLKQEPLAAVHPQVPTSLPGIESRLLPEDTGTLRQALEDLTRLIQSLGVSPRPFLSIVQNAPDQRVAPQGEVRKTSVVETLLRHWERGEHAQARGLLTSIAWSARDGNPRCLSELSRVVMSDDPALSVNASDVAEVLESLGWDEFALKFIDPSFPLLVPGFDASRRNNGLLIHLLGRPPATPSSAPALNSVLRSKPSKDSWGFRKHAANGLFALTTPAYETLLAVFDYWKNLIEVWPVHLPVLQPSLFGPSKDGAARWDVYEEHVRTAFSIAENPEQPQALRHEAVASVWKGYSGPESAPRPLWTVAYFRSRDLSKKESDLAWLQPYLAAYEKDAGITAEIETTAASPAPATSPAEEPLKLLGRFASFTRSRSRHLRLVSEKDDVFGESPVENLEKLTSVAETLGTYGLHLEAALVSGVMKTALEEMTSASDAVEPFRRSLYALNPAAAVTGWLDATGLPWPSYLLPRGHRIEGILSMLLWIRDREREPEELKSETARRYWEKNSLFSNVRWSPVRPDVAQWWRYRLEQELPAALAAQIRDTHVTGAPRSWTEYLRQHPEAEADIRAFAQSVKFPGTRVLAQKILQILFKRGR